MSRCGFGQAKDKRPDPMKSPYASSPAHLWQAQLVPSIPEGVSILTRTHRLFEVTPGILCRLVWGDLPRDLVHAIVDSHVERGDCIKRETTESSLHHDASAELVDSAFGRGTAAQ